MRVCPYSVRHVLLERKFPEHLKTCEVRANQLAENAIQVRAIKGKIKAPEPTQIYSIGWEDAIGMGGGCPLSSLNPTLRDKIARMSSTASSSGTIASPSCTPSSSSSSSSSSTLSSSKDDHDDDDETGSVLASGNNVSLIENAEDALSLGQSACDEMNFQFQREQQRQPHPVVPNPSAISLPDQSQLVEADPRACGKALIEFLVSADGQNCGARLIYAAAPEQESMVAYEQIDAPDFKAWLMGRINAFTKKTVGEPVFEQLEEVGRGVAAAAADQQNSGFCLGEECVGECVRGVLSRYGGKSGYLSSLFGRLEVGSKSSSVSQIVSMRPSSGAEEVGERGSVTSSLSWSGGKSVRERGSPIVALSPQFTDDKTREVSASKEVGAQSAATSKTGDGAPVMKPKPTKQRLLGFGSSSAQPPANEPLSLKKPPRCPKTRESPAAKTASNERQYSRALVANLSVDKPLSSASQAGPPVHKPESLQAVGVEPPVNPIAQTIGSPRAATAKSLLLKPPSFFAGEIEEHALKARCFHAADWNLQAVVEDEIQISRCIPSRLVPPSCRFDRMRF